jgi:hypothetical protein
MRFPRFSILNLLLATATVAVILAWWVDHKRLQGFVSESETLGADVTRWKNEYLRAHNENLRLSQWCDDLSTKFNKLEDKRGFIKLQPAGDAAVTFEVR